MAKCVKEALKFHRRTNRKQESGKGKHFEKSVKEKGKGFSKGKNVEYFNCGGLGHVSFDCLGSKDITKSIQATWSDIDSNESDSIALEDTWYDQTDYVTFVASLDSVHDSDSECEFNDQ